MVPKRKIDSTSLQRRVRPRRQDDWEIDHEESQASSSDDEEVEEQSSRRRRHEEDEAGDDSEDESGSDPDKEDDEDDDEPAAPKVDLSSISFGALAKAQASLPASRRKSKPASAQDTAQEDLQPLSARKSTTTTTTFRSKDDPKPKRSSKHAPQEQSSKRQVSRRREVVSDANPRRQHRDPRFDPLVGRLDEEKAARNYAFLDEYRDQEMVDLRARIKKTKNAEDKERLKRQLFSMESRKKARVRKEEADKVLKEHRKKEKELVAQGKTPFYLKKSEQKKQQLMDRYAGMSKGQVDRAIERKRKKVAGKEKKELDSLQRRPRD